MSGHPCHSAYVLWRLITLSPVPTARYRLRSAGHGGQARAFCQLRGFVTSNTATEISPSEKGPLRQKILRKYQPQHDGNYYLRLAILHDDDRLRSDSVLQPRTNQIMSHVDHYPMRSSLTTCFSVVVQHGLSCRSIAVRWKIT